MKVETRALFIIVTAALDIKRCTKGPHPVCESELDTSADTSHKEVLQRRHVYPRWCQPTILHDEHDARGRWGERDFRL